jgi:hypothetical protein
MPMASEAICSFGFFADRRASLHLLSAAQGLFNSQKIPPWHVVSYRRRPDCLD